MGENICKILLVDDNKTNLELMKVILEEEGYNLVSCNSAMEALRKLKRDSFDLVITDFLMPPGKNGIELTEEIKNKYPETEVIIITAYGDIENAVRAIKLQASDFIQRPLNNDIFLIKVKKALENKSLKTELSRIKKIFKDEMESQYRIVGNSFSMRNIIEKMKVVAATDSTVLITGASGTGKELFARTIHNLSNRRQNNFLAINCGAIPPNLIESELFGYKKGAFTGAYSDKIGLFEEASNGTLFLDEIGELPQQFQVKLLRVLQESEIRPVGSNKTTKINTRIITATNRDLQAQIEKGEFRKDLFYRLNVFPIEIPSLKERKEDIPLLANYFLAKYAGKYKKNSNSFSEAAISSIIRYPWPGNVRELENAIERAVILSHQETIETGALPEQITKEKITGQVKEIENYKKAKENFDKEYLACLLEYTRGNMKRASEIANKHRTDLYDMIKKYNIQIKGFRNKTSIDDEEDSNDE